jgi:hypothetical protein
MPPIITLENRENINELKNYLIIYFIFLYFLLFWIIKIYVSYH